MMAIEMMPPCRATQLTFGQKAVFVQYRNGIGEQQTDVEYLPKIAKDHACRRRRGFSLDDAASTLFDVSFTGYRIDRCWGNDAAGNCTTVHGAADKDDIPRCGSLDQDKVALSPSALWAVCLSP